MSPRERPIILYPPEVWSFLHTPKTQLRRVIRLPMARGVLSREGWRPFDPNRAEDHEGMVSTKANPLGQPGDRLWGKETWTAVECKKDGPGAFWGPDRGLFIENNSPDNQWTRLVYAADATAGTGQYGLLRLDDGRLFDGRWRPSAFMPRWASRLLFEVVSVRVARLHAITEEDARAEGLVMEPNDPFELTHRQLFSYRWWNTFGCKSWDSNPWVWVATLKRVEAPHA